jgi:hypothetical protein
MTRVTGFFLAKVGTSKTARLAKVVLIIALPITHQCIKIIISPISSSHLSNTYLVKSMAILARAEACVLTEKS